jgi:Cation/multidrug efflux pump
MNISAPFIARPVGTTLLVLAVALVGIVAYTLLPVSPLPQVDFATIRVSASMPGASPETMAATVATPLERALGRIAGITEMTSTSTQSNVSIVLQFDLEKDIDGAAREVQAAINASRAMLPVMPRNPSYRKMNPADAPIMVIGLTSDSLSQGELYDAASNIFSQKLSQIYGVGQVQVGGSSLPAVRVSLDPGRLQRAGISLEEVRSKIASANVNTPKGMLDNGQTQWFVGANDRLITAKDFAPLIIRYQDAATLRLADLGTVEDDVEDYKNVGYVQGKPAILVVISKQPGANILETVAKVRAAIPTIRSWMPDSVDLTIVMDRSPSIAASVREVEFTLLISMALVILVVFLFLRNGRATFIPAVAVPVSLLGTFGVMYLCGFTLNHLSLMAMTVSTGFVVDDAIVVTENIVRHMEDGTPPREAAYLGSKEVAFTVLSISLSLVAIFIPILGMGGIVGRLFKEFAVTMSAAILVSLVVSLVATPMMCARLLRPGTEEPMQSFSPYSRGLMGLISRLCYRLLAIWSNFMDFLHEGYARTLAVVLRYRKLTLCSLILTIGCNVFLFVIVPKGFFPQQDVGQVLGFFRGDQSISFQAVRPKLIELMGIVSRHEAVETVGGFTSSGQSNAGMAFLNLKPLGERKKKANQVIDDLRKSLAVVPGAELLLMPMQDLRMGGRLSRAQYQYTLQSDDLQLLRHWTPIITDALQQVPGMADVNSDQENRGLQTMVQVDRDRIAQMGITQKQVDTALGLAFGQSFASTIFTGSNQYRVVMEFSRPHLQGPEGLYHLYVPGGRGNAAEQAFAGTGLGGNAASTVSAQSTQSAPGSLVPLNAFSSFEPTLTSLSVSHQGQFTAATISFNLLSGYSLGDAQERIRETMLTLGVPGAVRGSFQGTAGAVDKSASDQGLLILAAFITLYIVLGVLYESLIHPLTILSTLPSAGMGAILGLLAFGAEFTVIAFIGVLLLAGIVKKNAIMMIDFAIDARRSEGLSAHEAIYKACLLRFRPIMMTTLAAVGGAFPLMLGSGDGAEMRVPLGITIVGGLLVSQILTLYTTPVVYLLMDRFSKEGRADRARKAAAGASGRLAGALS